MRWLSSASFIYTLTFVLLNPDIPCLCKQCRSRSIGFWSRLIWIAIQYVNLYQQLESSNLIGWKLEVGLASLFIQQDKDKNKAQLALNVQDMESYNVLFELHSHISHSQ